MCRRYFSSPRVLTAAASSPGCSGTGLLCPLVDPGSNQTDLLWSERSDAGFVLGRRHVIVRVDEVRDIVDEHALSALAGDDDLAVLAAAERAGEAVKPE